MTTSTREISGKWLIIAVVSLGLVGATASWWFRYAATHQAAQFWGPAAVGLIRDAPIVELQACAGTGPAEWSSDAAADRDDISAARGITHLRGALLQDHSFNWPSVDRAAEGDCGWLLHFRSSDSSERLTIAFDADYRHATRIGPGDQPPRTVSCEPIADSLAIFFAELSDEAAASR